MSDLFETRGKLEGGAEWRGEITVTIDDDQMDLTVRQLRDPEFWEVMALIDEDELSELQGELPEDKMEEFRDLQSEDDLSEAEEERLEELQTELENSEVNIFDVLSYDTYLGIKKTAKYCVEPDEEDKRQALIEHGEEIEEEYGRTADEEAAKWVNHNIIHPMIERSTDFASFTIGIKCLTESIGDTGNSKN